MPSTISVLIHTATCSQCELTVYELALAPLPRCPHCQHSYAMTDHAPVSDKQFTLHIDPVSGCPALAETK